MIDRAKILEAVQDLVATDPLSEVSRSERNALLITALASIAVAKGGFVPKELPALGISLSPAERLSLLYLATGILLFYLIGFWMYGTADLKRRRAVLASSSMEARTIVQRATQQLEKRKPPAGNTEAERKHMAELAEIADTVQIVTDVERFARKRIIFDVYVPLFIGLVALALVLHETSSYPGGQFITWGLLVGGALALLVTAWLRRKKLVHWIKVRRHRFYHRRFMRLSRRIQSLPEDSLRRQKLARKIQPYLDQSLKGPWV